MGKIRRLEKNVSELIAAGEVVERPSSIVKELVENSVDAGASRVTVEIRNGGITLIRVTDDGRGIPREEVPTAFVRHATSKVYTVEDLESIGTMGFRGEALPSIAAMSRVEVLTRLKDEITGTRYVIEGMEEIENTEVGCPTGTTILIKNLFYNTPARMKFLKKDVVEGNTIAALMDRLALANPKVSFNFIRDGISKLSTPGDGDLLSTIRVVCGSEVSSSMVEVNNTLGSIKVSGYISRPSYSKPSRALQHFFINDRFIRSKTCSLALEEAYKTKLMGGRFPVCVLKVSLPYSEVDVNVHPAKIEVRFSDEKNVYNGVYSACKLALDAHENLPLSAINKNKLTPFSLEAKDYSAMQSSFADKTADKKIDIYVTPKDEELTLRSAPIGYTRVNEHKPQSLSSVGSHSLTQHRAVPLHREEPHTKYVSHNPVVKPTPRPIEDDREDDRDLETPVFTIIGEVFKSYIVCEVGESMVLVDKHAAHERYLYKKLKENISSKERQLLLINNVVTLDSEEYMILIDNLEVLESIGIIADDFGDRSLIIRELAMVLNGLNTKELLADIAGKLKNMSNDLTPSALDKLLFSVACRCAVMAGARSLPLELKMLATIALEKDGAKYCPHGRPTIVELSNHDIQKMFGRLG